MGSPGISATSLKSSAFFSNMIHARGAVKVGRKALSHTAGISSVAASGRSIPVGKSQKKNGFRFLSCCSRPLNDYDIKSAERRHLGQ